MNLGIESAGKLCTQIPQASIFPTRQKYQTAVSNEGEPWTLSSGPSQLDTLDGYPRFHTCTHTPTWERTSFSVGESFSRMRPAVHFQAVLALFWAF